MTRFGQWLKRMVRFGYGSTDVATRFSLPRFRRDNRRAIFWTAWLALAVVGGMLGVAGSLHGIAVWSVLGLLALWPLQMARVALRSMRAGRPFGLSVAYAFFLMLSYWPQTAGQVLYWGDRLRRRAFRLIEYKRT